MQFMMREQAVQSEFSIGVSAAYDDVMVVLVSSERQSELEHSRSPWRLLSNCERERAFLPETKCAPHPSSDRASRVPFSRAYRRLGPVPHLRQEVQLMVLLLETLRAPDLGQLNTSAAEPGTLGPRAPHTGASDRPYGKGRHNSQTSCQNLKKCN